MRLADVIVRCRELTKVYDLYGEEKDRLKALLGLRANVKKFPALRGVTQDFHRGEIVLSRASPSRIWGSARSAARSVCWRRTSA